MADPCAICPGSVKSDAVAGYTCKSSGGDLLGDSNNPDLVALQSRLGRSLGKLRVESEKRSGRLGQISSSAMHICTGFFEIRHGKHLTYPHLTCFHDDCVLADSEIQRKRS